MQLVSIVTPLYNKGSHIARTIASVLAQSHQEFEFIIVDDGSTDHGPDIVSQHKDPRIRLIRQENAGPSAARNRGIQEAKFPLVAFIDADDEWFPDFLQTVLTLREQFPEARVWGTAYGIMNHDLAITPVPLRENVRNQPHGQLINYLDCAILEQPIHASSMLACKDVLLAIGGYKTISQPREDTDLLFRIALRYPIAFFPIHKTIYHKDAENRLDQWLWSGNYPFFDHAREFIMESGGNATLTDNAIRYLAYMHTGALYRNWLAGNKPAMREIIADCGKLPDCRAKCLFWRFLVWLPSPLVRLAWRTQSRMRGGLGELPPLRPIMRQLMQDKANTHAQTQPA